MMNLMINNNNAESEQNKKKNLWSKNKLVLNKFFVQRFEIFYYLLQIWIW